MGCPRFQLAAGGSRAVYYCYFIRFCVLAMASKEHEVFFNSLPGNELTPHEITLRQAILDFVNAGRPKSFPLTEWIDRRIGGEIETRRVASGQTELWMRGQAPPPANGSGKSSHRSSKSTRRNEDQAKHEKEAFFNSLNPNGFDIKEDGLRDSIFEFLAKWKSRELATLEDLEKDEKINRQRAGFMPSAVTLKDWIEQRIGGEVEFKQNSLGKDIIYITPAARPFVTQKYEQLAVGQSQVKTHGTEKTPEPPNRPGSPAPRAGSIRDAFFGGLPQNELTPDELALREALISYLEDWPKPNVRLGMQGHCPSVTDASNNTKIRKCRNAFIPPNIDMKDWIDRRIGAEIEVRKGAKGQFEILMRGQPPPAAAPKSSAGPPKAGASEPAEKAVSPDEFISKLPQDEHTEAEAALRHALVDYLKTKRGPAQLSEACKDWHITQCQSALLPPEVPLRIWIDGRIGGEVETFKDDVGRYMLKLRNGHVDSAGPENGEYEEAKEQFFDALPADGFTPDEEQLREALLDCVAGWKHRDPPTLSHTGRGGKIKKFAMKVLPKGGAVTLRDWIDRRIGGEIEMFDAPSGQVHFSLRGRMDQFQQSFKRRGDSSHGGDRKRVR